MGCFDRNFSTQIVLSRLSMILKKSVNSIMFTIIKIVTFHFEHFSVKSMIAEITLSEVCKGGLLVFFDHSFNVPAYTWIEGHIVFYLYPRGTG